ncbi:MAG: hypothetical protein IT307_00095 [Chloroflexi bacterium]|nr:hypothetical protein [Chloroflexota bacterium]
MRHPTSHAPRFTLFIHPATLSAFRGCTGRLRVADGRLVLPRVRDHLGELLRVKLGRLEPVVAGGVALVGIVGTTYGAFSHVTQVNAPSACSILVGGFWLGNALARHDLPLFPRRHQPPEGQQS